MAPVKIGYLFCIDREGREPGDLHAGWHVWCDDCAYRAGVCIAPAGCPLYRENVGDYRQTCHMCGKMLVNGKTPFWCELYGASHWSAALGDAIVMVKQ